MLCWATRVASQVLAAAASGTMPRATATIRTTNVADLRDGEMRHADCEACGGGAEPRGRGEVSVMSPANVPIFQFKSIIPIAGFLLFIQGIAQVCRCILCIRTGEWPPHLEDVEEMELAMQHAHEYDLGDQGDQGSQSDQDGKGSMT